MSQLNTTAGPLPVIDTNTITPAMEVISLQLGSDKPEKFDITSYDIARNIIEAIKEGVVDPLEFAVRRKLVTDAMDIAMKDPEVKSIMIAEVEKYGKQDVTALGAKVAISSRSTYQYQNDPTWASLKASIADTEAALKEQEKRIQAACKNNGSIIDQDSGEMIASIVPVKTTDSIAVSFAKKK